MKHISWAFREGFKDPSEGSNKIDTVNLIAEEATCKVRPAVDRHIATYLEGRKNPPKTPLGMAQILQNERQRRSDDSCTI